MIQVQIRQIESNQVNKSTMVAFMSFQMITGKCNSHGQPAPRAICSSDFGSHLTIATLSDIATA